MGLLYDIIIFIFNIGLHELKITVEIIAVDAILNALKVLLRFIVNLLKIKSKPLETNRSCPYHDEG